MKISLMDGVTIEQSYTNINSLKIENTSEKDINIELLFYCNSVVNEMQQWRGKIKSNTGIMPEIDTRNTNYFKVVINEINKGIIIYTVLKIPADIEDIKSNRLDFINFELSIKIKI